MSPSIPRASLLVLLAAAALGGCSAPGNPRAASAEFVSHAESAEADGGKAPEARPDFATAVAVGAIHSLMMSLVDGDPDAISRILPSFAADVEKRATVEAYPDADEVSLFEWESTRYETNGTYTTTWTSLSRILTQRGLEENRTFSFGNNDFYGSTTVLVARVFSPGGAARDIDLAANLAEAIDTGSLASNIHDPNDKTFTLALPGLQVGDTVALVMRRETRRPRCEGVYSDYLTFESDHPILLQGACITGPASMPLRSRAFRDPGPVSLEHFAATNDLEGTVTEWWSVKGETPRFFAEPHMPPAYDCTARLLLSTAPDWESLSRWYARLCAPHLAATNAAMRAKVDELLRTALSAPPAAGSDRLLDDSRAKSAEAEAADRRAFRELNPEFRLDELDELWCWIVDLRLQEARLRREVLRLWGEVLGPGETVEKAERDVREATDAAPRDEGNSLSNRLEALPESERDSFLEDVWVERRAESRRLQGAIVDLKQRLEVFVVEADPHEEAAEGADDGGASSPSEPQDRAPHDRATRADESDPAEWANAVFVGHEFLSSLESENPGPLALDPDEALKRRLGEFGVEWPAGSFVRIFPECHAFAVCNSRSNLDILSLALGDASPEPRVLEIDRETPIHPWWFFGGDGPEAVSRRKLALWRDADFFGWEDSEDAADSIETLVEKVLRADTVLRRVRREEATFRSEVFRLCVSGKPAGRAERALRDYESAKQEAQADDEDARRDSLMWHIEDRPETNRLDFVSSLLDERLSDIRELIPQIGLWRWQISLLTNAGPDGLKQAPASAEGLAPAVRAAASALGTGTRVLLPEPRNGEGVAQFGCAGGPHGFLDDNGLYIIRKEFARAGIPLVAGPSVDGFFRPPNLSEEYERRIAWGNAHSDAILGGTLDPPNLHDPVPIGRRFDLATPDGSLAVEFLSRDDHRELEQEEPKDPAELGVLSTGEDFDFPLRMSRYAETLRARRDGRPLLVAVFFEPFGPDPAFALRLQVRKVLAALRSESAPRAAQGEPANAGEAGLEPANLRTRAERPPRAQREAAIRALFDFVSREVRYMGAMAESEAPGYEPHDVSLTFDNRYGVCRDKAALLVAMLRMAGIDAWPVLINVGPRKDPQVPQPYFNHAIVAADSGDPADPYLLMDPTSETTRSLLPEYLCEMSYLVARDEGETIRETPPLPVEGNLLRAHTVFTLNDDASADVKTTLSFLGVNDAAYRGYFASIPRDNIRAFFERLLQGVPGAVLTRWELQPAPEDLRKSPEPLVATVEYAIAEAAREARGAADGAGGAPEAALLDLPDLAGSLAIASRVVGDLGLEKRRFPLVTDYPCGWEETVELRLPDGAGLAPQPDVRHEVPANLFVDAATNAPSGAPGRYRALKLFRSRYSPEEYGELRAAREAEERADRAPLRLEGPGVAALFAGREFGDGLSNVLARAVEPAPTDDLYTEFSRTTVDVSRAPEEWTVETTTRRRILTYAGQRKAGDVTLRWNPATTDLLVTNACVILPDGTATPVDPKLDLFEGDQEWVADAPRYPAGKIATVSFPKLAPGCAVEWTVVRRAHDRDLFSFAETLGSCGSFGEISVTVAGTNGTARSFRVDDPYWKTIADRFPVETNATDSATTYTVRGGGPGSQIVSEPNMPPLSRLVPVLRASSQTAPERARALAERMWALSDPAVQTNAAALARSLVPKGFDPNARRTILAGEYSVVDPGKGPGAAVFAIRDWCAVNLREAGPAYWDLPLSALSPADATLAARYGHEADIRILQLAMLRALGLCEGFGAFSSGTAVRLYNADWDGAPARRRTLGFASPSTFDTIDLVVSEATWGPLSVIGTCCWSLDGATQYAPPLACRNEGRAHLFVRLPLSGPDGPDRIPIAKADGLGPGNDWGPDYPGQSGTETEYTIRVREDGSAEIGVSVSHSGSDYEAFRKRYEEILPEERRRDAQRLAAAISQSAKLKGDVETLTPPNGPCTKLLFAVEVPDFAVRDGDRLVFRLPGALSLSPQARERRFPFRRASDDLSCTACSVWVPFGWRVAAAPAAIRFGDPATNADYAREVADDEGARILRVRTRRRLERAEFDASLFPAFQRDALRTHGPDAETVILERAPSAN